MKDHLKNRCRKDKGKKKKQSKIIKNLKKHGNQNFPKYMKNKLTKITSENK
jgi:hypothetical protein